MEFIWQDRYSVENHAIDQEHKHIVRLMNEFYRESQTSAWDKCKLILDNLTQVVVDHFAHEEDMMTKADFAGLPTHKVIHTQLIKQASDIFGKFKEDPSAEASKEISLFLSHWLASHICGIDMKYKDDLKKL